LDIRDANPGDAAAIAAIYNHYVLHTVVSMEEQPVSDAEMAQRIADIGQAGLPWLVMLERDVVAGYAYASKWRARPGYRYSVESTVYLGQAHHGRGLGQRLYRILLDRLDADGYRQVIGGIALPNDASVALHEKLGFEKVAQFREVGTKFGGWVDVGYWQKRLGEPS
jgi:L-amino acid N-acyltransferase YncA